MWEVEYTDEFGTWWGSLRPEDQDRVAAAVELLEAAGPSLGRPLVDTVRAAILLLGGDKRGCWEDWYVDAIPEADRLYDGHLKSLLEEGSTDDE